MPKKHANKFSHGQSRCSIIRHSVNFSHTIEQLDFFYFIVFFGHVQPEKPLWAGAVDEYIRSITYDRCFTTVKWIEKVSRKVREW